MKGVFSCFFSCTAVRLLSQFLIALILIRKHPTVKFLPTKKDYLSVGLTKRNIGGSRQLIHITPRYSGVYASFLKSKDSFTA